MKTFTAIAALAAVVPAVVGQQLTVNTPANVVQCEPVQITWSSTTPPYYLSFVPANQPTAPAIKQFPPQQETSYTWLVDLQANTNFCINTSVNEGPTGSSGSSDSSPSNTSGGSSPTSSGGSSASKSSSASSTTSAPSTASASSIVVATSIVASTSIVAATSTTTITSTVSRLICLVRLIGRSRPRGPADQPYRYLLKTPR
ncbi:hypothetical protein EWM64_g10016 [Hericium alpestre]|uniref:Fibronectin type-III domain-containing protein n=1 Tax=Hericium alpestre TaxID=135208 RepID=A0A4Y9ZGW5_9AGAM|nr:hypothetical protein EWM64_g10016 [Hericium alpestre]